MRASTASHHAPFASACPLALHAAWHVRAFACRFRMPLGAFARARTTTTTQAAHTTHKCSDASHHHSRILLASSPSCCRHHPHAHRRAHTRPHHKPPLPLLPLIPLLLQTASHHRNQQAHSRKPSQLNVRPPIIITSITPTPHRHSATHIPPLRYYTAQMLLLATGRSHRHRAVQTPCKPPCSTPPSHCTAQSPDAPPLLLAVTLHGTCALAQHRCLACAITGITRACGAHAARRTASRGVLTAAAAWHRAAAASTDAARHLRTATPPLLGTRNQRGIRPSWCKCGAPHCKCRAVSVSVAAGVYHSTVRFTQL